MMEFRIFAIELFGHQECIFAQMQFLSAAHQCPARLLPGKHANSLAHFQLHSPRRQNNIERARETFNGLLLTWFPNSESPPALRITGAAMIGSPEYLRLKLRKLTENSEIGEGARVRSLAAD